MRSIRWTRQALEDIEAIHDFIARDSARYADHFIEGIIQSVDRLGEFPRSGRVVPEIGEDTLREVIHASYRVVHRVSGDSIEILTVVHSARLLRLQQ